MNIGSTPTHVFTLPDSITTANISKAQITYAQSGAIILKKETADITVGTHTLTVTLTQAQTFNFYPYQEVELQVRILMNDSTALASNIVKLSAQKCLGDLVLTTG